MKDFVDYIESSCAGIAESPELYKFKKQTLEKMTVRANEITAAGLSDDEVLCDLLADEFPDLKSAYESFAAGERKKKRSRRILLLSGIGSIAVFAIAMLIYFVLSFATGCWRESWLIIVGTVFAIVIYWFSFLIKRLCRMRRIFHPIARALTGGCIMLITVFLFLVTLMLLPVTYPWTVLLAGVIGLFAADAVFATVTRQKFAVINYLLYIPAAAALLYVILGAWSVVAWSTGWLIIIAGVVIDLIIMIGIAISNSKYIYKQEDDDEWNAD